MKRFHRGKKSIYEPGVRQVRGMGWSKSSSKYFLFESIQNYRFTNNFSSHIHTDKIQFIEPNSKGIEITALHRERDPSIIDGIKEQPFLSKGKGVSKVTKQQ